MKIIAVAGTGSGCGKTTAACRILRAIPGLGAVKISPRDGPSRVEWGAGETGKDTALFVESGAVRAARIIGPRETVVKTWELIEAQFDGCRGVVIEGASALLIPGQRFVVFVQGNPGSDSREQRTRALAANSDAIIDRSPQASADSLISEICAFLASPTNE